MRKWFFYSGPVSLLAVLIFFPSFSAYAQHHWDGHVNKKTLNNEYVVFADDVNIRQSADTNSTILFKLRAGDSVKVTAMSANPVDIGGTVEYWYEILFRGRKGMVWGGLLADAAFSANGWQILLRNLGIKKEKMEIRLMRPGRPDVRTTWNSGPVSGDEGLKIFFYKTEGFQNAPELIFAVDAFVFSEIEYGSHNRFLFTLSRNQILKNHFSWCPGACDPPSCMETTVLFPGDAMKKDDTIRQAAYSGERNKIRLVIHHTDTDDAQSHEYFVQDYDWNGQDFVRKE